MLILFHPKYPEQNIRTRAIITLKRTISLVLVAAFLATNSGIVMAEEIFLKKETSTLRPTNSFDPLADSHEDASHIANDFRDNVEFLYANDVICRGISLNFKDADELIAWLRKELGDYQSPYFDYMKLKRRGNYFYLPVKDEDIGGKRFLRYFKIDGEEIPSHVKRFRAPNGVSIGRELMPSKEDVLRLLEGSRGDLYDIARRLDIKVPDVELMIEMYGLTEDLRRVVEERRQRDREKELQERIEGARRLIALLEKPVIDNTPGFVTHLVEDQGEGIIKNMELAGIDPVHFAELVSTYKARYEEQYPTRKSPAPNGGAIKSSGTGKPVPPDTEALTLIENRLDKGRWDKLTADFRRGADKPFAIDGSGASDRLLAGFYGMLNDAYSGLLPRDIRTLIETQKPPPDGVIHIGLSKNLPTNACKVVDPGNGQVWVLFDSRFIQELIIDWEDAGSDLSKEDWLMTARWLLLERFHEFLHSNYIPSDIVTEESWVIKNFDVDLAGYALGRYPDLQRLISLRMENYNSRVPIPSKRFPSSQFYHPESGALAVLRGEAPGLDVIALGHIKEFSYGLMAFETFLEIFMPIWLRQQALQDTTLTLLDRKKMVLESIFNAIDALRLFAGKGMKGSVLIEDVLKRLDEGMHILRSLRTFTEFLGTDPYAENIRLSIFDTSLPPGVAGPERWIILFDLITRYIDQTLHYGTMQKLAGIEDPWSRITEFAMTRYDLNIPSNIKSHPSGKGFNEATVADNAASIQDEDFVAVGDLPKTSDELLNLIASSPAEYDETTVLKAVAHLVARYMDEMGYGDLVKKRYKFADAVKDIEIQEIDPDDLPYPGGLNIGIFPGVLPGLEGAAYWASRGKLGKANFLFIPPIKGLYFDAGDPSVVLAKSGLFLNKSGKLVLARFKRPVRLHTMVNTVAHESKAKGVLEGKGIPLLNDSATTLFVNDKAGFGEFLQKAGVPTPEFIIIKPEDGADGVRARIKELASRFKDEGIVIKPNGGSGGSGVQMFAYDQVDEASGYALGHSTPVISGIRHEVTGKRHDSFTLPFYGKELFYRTYTTDRTGIRLDYIPPSII